MIPFTTIKSLITRLRPVTAAYSRRLYWRAADDAIYATKAAPRPCDYVMMTVALLCDDIGVK